MLTSALLDPCHQYYFRDAFSRYEMHRTVKDLTGDGGILWRLNRPRIGSIPKLFVRSDSPQNWGELISTGYVLEVKELAEEKGRFSEGSIMPFQIECSPSKKHRKQRRFLKEPAEQTDWFRRAGLRYGFYLELCHPTAYSKSSFDRDGEDIILYTVGLHGILTVTNVNLFSQALDNGIGPGKAFGAGLLLVHIDGVKV